jgi:senataxin
MDDLSIQLAIAERKEAKAKAAAKAVEKAVEVSSSANESPDSSSEESVEETGLKELGGLHKSPEKIKKAMERKTAILMNKPVTRTIPQAAGERSERRTRYIPDMTPLYRIILSWDYSYDGPEPPNSGISFKLRPIPDVFTSHRHYLDVFHPLLIVECWNALIKSKEEQLDQVECTITGKMHADVWVEIDISIEHAVPKGWMLSETDIVLLKHPSQKQVLCKVQSSRQVKQGIQATLRYLAERLNVDGDRTLALQSIWLVSRVFRFVSAIADKNMLTCTQFVDTA